MALPAVIASMITVTCTAAGALGIIKRRCGASEAIIDLSIKSAELVDKIHLLLKTLEASTEVPYDAREISTALNLRREEFDKVQKNLDKMERRTRRTRRIDRTEKFITAQGWAKKMGAIYSDLVELRNGIESIVSSWGVGQFVVKKVVEKIETIDVTMKKESDRQAGRWYQRADDEMMGSGTLTYVDRIQMTMVKLTDANKLALNRYGNLEHLSLPDALFEASRQVEFIDFTCHIQLLQRSAELLHPGANYHVGVHCKWGGLGMEANLDLAISHYRVASSRGNTSSLIELIRFYDYVNDRKNLLKYFKILSNMDIDFYAWIVCLRVAIEYRFEAIPLVQPLIGTEQHLCAFQQSLCHFFELGVPKSNQKAIDALQGVDSNSYSVRIKDEGINHFRISFYDCYRNDLGFYGWKPYPIAFRCYADFLFKSNQFLPFLLLSFHSIQYSSEKLKRYVLHAARKNCVDAHLFLAAYYSKYSRRNERGMKQHLRIAADAGNSHAQLVCRQMFGSKVSVFKELRQVSEEKDGSQEKDRHRPRAKHSKRNKLDSQKKRSVRASKQTESKQIKSGC